MHEPATPLMRQYHTIKRQHPHALLLFRLGDFYELFYEDAIVASRELQITLTSRNRERGQPVPMCGVPYHAADNYIARLIRAGYKVAICEQLEEPSRGKKLVRRDVVRVITPGTATDLALLEPRENNYLAAIARAPSGQPIGLAFLDISTGEFRATEFAGPQAEAQLRDELETLRPREILLPRADSLFAAASASEFDGAGGAETRLDEWVFRRDYGERVLCEQFGVVTLDGFGLAGREQAVAAAGALVHYLRETTARSDKGLHHLNSIGWYEQQESLVLDNVSVRNLELVSPLFADFGRGGDGAGQPTLLSTLDETVTGMGARLLRAWILRPSIDVGEIEARLDAVSELKAQTVAREELRKELAGVLDLERLTSRVTLGLASPRDVLALRKSLSHLPLARGFLAQCSSLRIVELCAAIEPESTGLAEIERRIAATISEDPPALASEPGIIRRGSHAELDELRTLSTRSKQILAAMEERERKRTGIASLKIRFNQVFGYYIEVSKPNLHLVPADYERKQTLVNAERFTAPELKEHERKILEADEKILEIERRLFTELRAWIAQQAGALRRAAAAIGQLDVLVNLARVAAARNFTRPEFSPDNELTIHAGRHPVIEKLLVDRGQRFVPNDLYLNDTTHMVLLITGPNMGGKSTYLRQAALIVLMAQIGSFVPATQARLPVVDRIYTRIGAMDNLARGRSTFLVEMTEVATILNTATSRSLVLLDEVGRGTATFDGLSLAWAVVEYIASHTRAKTLFATHYHEITELADLLPGVKNLHVSVKESGHDIVFLKRVEPGPADKSYGIEVARLAGLPREVIERARVVLARHEQSEHELSENLSPGAAPPPQEVMFTPLDRAILEALRQADLDNLKPLDALNMLAELKKRIS
jgi:DNA mismatch repair protein MutS